MSADPLETIIVETSGGSFTGFSDISIVMSAEEAVRTASMTATDFGGAFPLLPDTDVKIFASGTLILTGYVRDCSPSHDGQGWSASISIVSRTIDAVECSIDHKTGFAKDKDLGGLAQAFDTCGVGVDVTGDFPKEPPHFVKPGASLFDEIEPLSRAQGAFLYDTPEGRLKIAKKPQGRHAGGLKRGVNILSASAQLTSRGRHSPVIVRGQTTQGDGDKALKIEARATDGGVKRSRPLVLIDEAEGSKARLKGRAERHVRRACGYSRTAEITVSGWRDAGGRIYEPHYLIHVDDERIYIRQDMAIQSVTLKQSMDGGTQATLSLADPRAMNGDAPVASGSDGVWSTDVRAE